MARSTLRIFSQLVREFWLPLLLAFTWTGYSVLSQPRPTWLAFATANTFFITFFGIAWWFGQWNRVKKQQKVEDGLGGITEKTRAIADRTQLLLDTLEQRTLDLAGHITGGDAYCYVIGLNHQMPALCGDQNYAIHDLSAQFIDLDLLAKNSSSGAAYCGEWFDFGTLHSRTALHWPAPVDLSGGRDRRYFNVNFQARNGAFYQQIRYALVEGKWRCALRVFRANPEVVLREIVERDFPRKPDGTVEWSYPD